MKKLILGLLLLSTLAHAHEARDYELLAFENDSFRDFSMDEFREKIGENQWLLPYYVCNGRDEYDPFHLPLRSNPERNSLRVRAHDSQEILIYREGEFFDQSGRRVRNFSDPMFRLVAEALRRFEGLASTSQLLRLLEASYFPITIRFGGNMFDPQIEHGKHSPGIYMAQAIMYFVRGRMADDSLTFNNIGVGGDIRWHPRLRMKTIEADGVERELDPHVALAHEMFHALDSIRGLIDFRMVRGQRYESQMISEYRAVFFENLVRKEMGLKYRKYYSEKQGPGMLDERGEPHQLPAPCLK
jgi:hypothetical protein